jgi:hypothetical protein
VAVGVDASSVVGEVAVGVDVSSIGGVAYVFMIIYDLIMTHSTQK